MKTETDGNRGFPCVSVNLEDQKLVMAPSVSPGAPAEQPQAPKPWEVTSTTREVKVCRAGSKECKTITINAGKNTKAGHGDAAGETLIASLSGDGTKLAVLVPVSKKDLQTAQVEVFDVAKNRRIQSVEVPTGTSDHPGLFADASDLWSVSWMTPDHLLLGTQRCCGPAGASGILDLRSKRVEAIGDPSMLREVRKGIWLMGTSDRFDESENTAIDLVFLHLEDGKRTKLHLPARPNKEPQGHELDAHPWKGSTWAIAHSTPPGAILLDVEQEKILQALPFPLCP